MKRCLSLVLCCLLVILAVFSGGCGDADSGKLVICFDLGSGDSTGEYQVGITSFLHWIDDCHKYFDFPITSEDIQVDLIPGTEADATERAAALQRVRAELMAGKGPDIFIGYPFGESPMPGEELKPMENGRLFPYLENSMEKGFFLPLEEILSNLTYGDAEDFIPQLMEGGKNQKGEQVILPLTFSIPGMFFSGEDAPQCDYEGLSWYDVINSDDPVLLEQSVWALDYYKFDAMEYIRTGAHDSALFCLFPRTVDFENETPSFSEEELAGLIKDSLDAYRRAMERDTDERIASVYFTLRNILVNGGPLFIPDGNGPYTFVPLRNLEGGSTALVNTYFAVNANTRKSKQITAVLDALLHPDYWHSGRLPGFFNGMYNSREFTTPGKQIFGGRPFSETLCMEWQRACEDINIVRYPSAIDAELDSMMDEIEDTMFLCRNEYSGLPMRDEKILQGSLTDEELMEIVSKHYQQIQHLIDES